MRSVSLQIFSAKNTGAPLPLAMKSDAPALTWEALTLPNSSPLPTFFAVHSASAETCRAIG
jgi:hypothetical protein